MRAGRMDRQITFQEKTANSSDYNDPRDASWGNISTNPTVWAEKVPVRGSESVESARERAVSVVRWFTYYRDDISEDMRIKEGSSYYYILSIMEVGREEGIEILTEKRV